MEYYINVHRFSSGAPHAVAFRTRLGALESLAEDWLEGGVWNYEHTLYKPPRPLRMMATEVALVIDLEDEARRLADEWRAEAKEPARLKAAHEARQL